MRITHVTSSLKRGGAEAVLTSVVTHPMVKNWHHTIIYFHHGPFVDQLKGENITLHHIPYGLLFPFRFIYFFIQSRPLCVHALLWNGIVWGVIGSWIMRVPLVVVFHNNIVQNAWWKNAVDWFLLLGARNFIAVSDEVALGVTRYHQWIEREKITVIYNGVDPVSEKKLDIKDTGFPDNAFIVGMVARFEPVKRHWWFIERLASIMQTMPNVYCVLIGEGSQEHTIRELLTFYGISQKVYLVIGQDARPWYSCFDMITLTSCKEGISMALLEAMSIGIPPLMTNDDSVHPLIKHADNGFLVRPDDKNAYEEYMKKLIAYPDLRIHMGSRARKIVKSVFSRDAMVYAYKHYIEKMIQ